MGMRKITSLAALLILTVPARGAAIAPAKAFSQIGKTVTVEGVARVQISKGVTLITFQTVGKNELITGVIPKNSANKFKHPENLNGKMIRIMGQVQSDHGKPQIVLTSPDQISVS